jgi:hypothetical protein
MLDSEADAVGANLVFALFFLVSARFQCLPDRDSHRAPSFRVEIDVSASGVEVPWSPEDLIVEVALP